MSPMVQFAKRIVDYRKINEEESMDILVERLDAKLREWKRLLRCI